MQVVVTRTDEDGSAAARVLYDLEPATPGLLSWMHDVAMTEEHLVFVEQPLFYSLKARLHTTLHAPPCPRTLPTLALPRSVQPAAAITAPRFSMHGHTSSPLHGAPQSVWLQCTRPRQPRIMQHGTRSAAGLDAAACCAGAPRLRSRPRGV